MSSKEEKTETEEAKPASSETKEEEKGEEAKEEEKETSKPAEAAEPAAKPAAAAKEEPGKEEEKVKPSEPAVEVEKVPEKEAVAESLDDSRGKRVYVGNLAWEVSWQDLKDHMKSTGLDVARASVMTTADGRSKGCGIVEFTTKAHADEAVLTLNDTELKGRQIFVREDREDSRSGGASFAHGGGAAAGHRFSSGEDAQNRRVYVGNLSWDVAWQDLKDHMREAGEVVHAEIITEQSGRSKGCGIVEYATQDEAEEAIKMLTDTELKGRMIFVREDRETSSQAHHTGAGRGQQNTSVYVWNLSPETSWQDLKDHMRKAGNVDSATILSNSQGESICCGVVVYQKPQEATRAIRELQNSELNGSQISVREDRAAIGRGMSGRGGAGRGGGGRGYGRGYGGRGTPRSSAPEGTQVFVGNLSYDTTWRELRDHFRQCGEVNRAEVATNYGGRSKGFGTVQFFNKQDADSAISRLNGSELQGRELEVRLDKKAR